MGRFALMKNLKITAYDSFEDEAKAETKRRATQTPQERLKEFSELQDRCFGKGWNKKKMMKIASWETVSW